jgi:hypothetical protein
MNVKCFFNNQINFQRVRGGETETADSIGRDEFSAGTAAETQGELKRAEAESRRGKKTKRGAAF